MVPKRLFGWLQIYGDLCCCYNYSMSQYEMILQENHNCFFVYKQITRVGSRSRGVHPMLRLGTT